MSRTPTTCAECLFKAVQVGFELGCLENHQVQGIEGVFVMESRSAALDTEHITILGEPGQMYEPYALHPKLLSCLDCYILGAAPTLGSSLEQGHAPPLRRTADADDARPLRSSATHSKNCKTSPHAEWAVASAPHQQRRTTLCSKYNYDCDHKKDTNGNSDSSQNLTARTLH